VEVCVTLDAFEGQRQFGVRLMLKDSMPLQCVSTTAAILAHVTFGTFAAVAEMGQRVFVERLTSGKTLLTGGARGNSRSNGVCPLSGHCCPKPATHLPTFHAHFGTSIASQCQIARSIGVHARLRAQHVPGGERNALD